MEDTFHWGVSSSAPQSEGATFQDGKGLTIWDEFSFKRKNIKGAHTPEVSCSFYFRYKEDIELMREMNIPNFRFSISWARVLPNGTGHINQKGIDFYDRLTDCCLENNITPWVTLYHWDLPYALELKGGWTNREIVHWYSEYVQLMLSKLGDRVKYWMALNEPLVFTGAGYFLGVHAPGRKGMENFLAAVHHAALAQSNGIRLIKEYDQNLQAGTTFSVSPVTPFSNSKKDLLASIKTDALLNRLFLEPLLGYGYPVHSLPFLQRIEKYIKNNDESQLKTIPDFVGLQNYTREVVKYSWLTPYLNSKQVDARARKAEHTQLNWEVYPEGIYEILKQVNAYPEIKSIIITENGAAFPDKLINAEVNDAKRKHFLQRYIQNVLKAKRDKIKVDGYFIWSFSDNFEWAEGYFPRFGIVYIDYKNQKRIIKESGKWFSQMIKEFINCEHEVPSC